MHYICVEIQQIQGNHLPDQITCKIRGTIADSLTPKSDFYFFSTSFIFITSVIYGFTLPYIGVFSNCDFFYEILIFFTIYFRENMIFSNVSSGSYCFSYKIRYGILSLSTDNAMRIVL